MIKVYTNFNLSKEFFQDHTFLILNDNIYIDPTFNQLKENNFCNNWFIGKYNDIDKNLIEKDLFKKQYDITNKVNNFIRNNLL